ncbi:MAG: ribonuclease HI family protein, partial [Candidatus Aenigmatarchaeota archaeon]
MNIPRPYLSQGKEYGSMTLEIYTDGASRGNPGPASYAYLIMKDSEEMTRGSGFLGKTTNNRAEYKAVIEALSKVRSENEKVVVNSDSRLVVNQMSGKWKVKSQNLQPLHTEVKELAEGFKEVSFNHVPRENKYISIVDGMCNEELDRQA